MIYADEEILKLREEEKKRQFNTLETGIYLKGDVLKFKKQILMDAFSISLPEVIGGMPMEYARIKYPSEFRPQVILTTPELDANFGFTLFPSEVSNKDLKAVAGRIRRVIKRAHPDYQLYPGKYICEEKGYYFGFRSHALDSDLYNMSLLMQIKDRLLQGSFNCIYKEYIEWKNIVLMIWETIQEWE